MSELINRNTPLRRPRNSIAIPFLFNKIQNIRNPITNILKLIEIGKLSAGILHDLMGPVTALTLYTSQLELEKSDPRTTAVIESSKRIEELLGLVRKHFRSETLVDEYFSVKETIKNVMTLLHYKSTKNNVRLIMIGKPDLEINGKQLLFYQIIINLVSNAIDSYQIIQTEKEEEKRKDVIIKIEETEENLINIYVKDFGCGLTPKQQRKIFKCFYSDKSNGTGIGLAVVQQIVRKNFNGKIRFSSELNKGSTFIVSIPMENKIDRKFFLFKR